MSLTAKKRWLFCSVLLLFTSAVFPRAFSSEPPLIISYPLKGTIHGGTAEIVKEIFDEAKEKEAEAILIELDTPGGLLDSTEEIVKLFLNTNIPVIVYVSPSGAKAGSAGTFITLAAHIAAMAPGTYIGAAHPVSMFGGGGEKEGEEQKIMKQKIESAVSSFISAIAKQRGRNEQWARKAVLESESITEDQAVQKRVIDLVAQNREDLLFKIDGRTIRLADGTRKLAVAQARIIDYRPDLKLRFLNFLANPVLIYLLILGVIAGIYLEVSHPGTLFPGIGAAVCLILALVASRVLPVNALGLLLIVGALALLVAEIYVTSYGLLTVAAIGAFFAGSLLLFDPVRTGVQVPLSYIIGSSGALAAIAIIIGCLVLKATRRQQTAGREGLIGKTGVVEDPIEASREGRIFIAGEYWNATADSSIAKGEEVVVAGIKGLRLHVKKSAP